MAEFKLGRLKFVWKGPWVTSTVYVKDDIIRNGGRSYVCLLGHTANANFYTDESASRWEVMTDGQEWRGDWTPSTYYKLNDLVKNSGVIYLCDTPHTSGAYLELDQDLPSETLSKWTNYTKGFAWKNDWTINTYYRLDDIVRNGANAYMCITPHTSSGTVAGGLEEDQAKWTLLTASFEYKLEWADATRYKVNDVVKYGANTYLCLTQHVSATNLENNIVNWELLTAGFEYIGDWTQYIQYQIGQVVKYGGTIYQVLYDNISVVPTNTGSWTPLVSGYELAGDWVTALAYLPGMVVKYGANTYLCTVAHTSSALFPTDLASKWTILNTGIRYRGIWDLNTDYLKDDVVASGTSTYIAIEDVLGGVTPNTGLNSSYVLFAAGAEGLVAKAGDVMTGDLQITQDSHLYVGTDAQSLTFNGFAFPGSEGLTDAIAIFDSNTDAFAQIGLKNQSAGLFASTDLIAYTDNGDNGSGWIDMGITSSNYDITSGFGITGKHDGYIFMEAPVDSIGTGNLVIATGENGTDRDIIFVTGGFDPTVNLNAIKVKIIGQERLGAIPGVEITMNTIATSPTTGALRVIGGIGLTGNLFVGGDINIQGTITIGGSGSALATSALAVTDPTIRMATGNPGDTLDVGFVAEYGFSTLLTADISDSDTTITVFSTTVFPTTGTLYVGTEFITYTGKTSTTFTGCGRGASGTTPAPHVISDSIRYIKYTGLIRDSADELFHLFQELTINPSTQTDFSDPLMSHADLQIGALIGTGATITGNATVTLEPTAKTHVANKIYVDRMITLNTMWTSGWR